MDYAAFLRFTLAGQAYAWGSREEYRAGQWHDGVLASWPTPQEAWPDQYGLLPIQRFDIEAVNQPDNVLDEAGLAMLDEAGDLLIDEALGGMVLDTPALAGTTATLDLVTTTTDTDLVLDESGGTLTDEAGDPIHDEQAGVIERVYTKTVCIAASRLTPGKLTLTLADIESTRLDQTYPSSQFTAADWPELYQDHVGRPVPWATGTAIKIPLTLIQTNAGAGPWVYAACVAPATVLTVYRDGRIVGASEYTVATLTAPSSYTVVTLSFIKQQTDSGGRYYTLSADMLGAASRNPATELARVLTAAGLTPDPAAFSSAAAQCAALGINVDIGYTAARSFRAIIDDLGLILRGHIYRLASGNIGVTQDVPGSILTALDESAGDWLAVDELDIPERPANIELHYKPSPADPSQTLHTLTRAAGGSAGVIRYDALYLSDHTDADMLACYLANRIRYNGRLKARVYGQAVSLGDILALTAPNYWSGTRNWRIANIQRPAAGAQIEALQYDPAIYVYTPGTLPSDAVTGYQPDYSNTPPAAPTALAIVSSGAVVASTGSVSAWVKLKATPPSVNWAQMWFAATNDATSEVYQAQGTDNGDGTWGATIPGLRPADAHHVIAWAVNANGVLGLVTTPVAHTSATDSTVPAVPSGLGAYQGVGSAIKLVWTAVTDTDLAYYEIQISVGGGAYGTHATVPANPSASVVVWSNSGYAYGTLYGWKVRAVDRAGNASAYCTPVTITPAANVNTADVVNSAVTTAKRQAVTTASATFTFAGNAGVSLTVTHNLGREVVATAFSSNSNIIPWIQTVDLNSFHVICYNISSGTQSNVTYGANYW